MTSLLTTVTNRSKKAIYAAANHLTAVTTWVAAAVRITGIASLTDATFLTANNAEAWEVAQRENATHPVTRLWPRPETRG